MSKMKQLLLIFLPAVLPTTCGDMLALQFWCFWSSDDLRDMVYIDAYIMNKIKYAEFNSSVGKYVGYTASGIKSAKIWNENTALMEGRRAEVETVCKRNARIYNSILLSQTVEPQVKVRLVKQSDGSHPARLICSAHGFYPPYVKVTWLRNGKNIEGDVTSIEKMADGDWYYQVHSHLEYKPESGEEISCVVEHASFKKPMSYKWVPSTSEPDKSKIAIGASGLVLGLVLSAAGFIYYRKKSSGQWINQEEHRKFKEHE
ncbi:class II histocompatibility antigen, B-L beta chain-like [Clarias gariepinus]